MIGSNNRTELLPEIFVSIGTDSTVDQVKVALEAPRNIKILRDNLYKAAQAAQAAEPIDPPVDVIVRND